MRLTFIHQRGDADNEDRNLVQKDRHPIYLVVKLAANDSFKIVAIRLIQVRSSHFENRPGKAQSVSHDTVADLGSLRLASSVAHSGGVHDVRQIADERGEGAEDCSAAGEPDFDFDVAEDEPLVCEESVGVGPDTGVGGVEDVC